MQQGTTETKQIPPIKMANTQPRRHRILVFHGDTQCAELISARMDPLIRKLNDIDTHTDTKISIDFVFFDAPYLNTQPQDAGNAECKILRTSIDADDKETVTPTDAVVNPGTETRYTRRQWWKANLDLSSDENPARPARPARPTGDEWIYDTGAESVAYTLDFIKKNGPFTGALGFSQGGCLMQLLPERILRKFRYLIFVGSPPVGKVSGLPSCYTHLRTMHIAGKADQVVKMSESRNLCDLFTNGFWYTHDKVHCIPTNQPFAEALRAFIVFSK